MVPTTIDSELEVRHNANGEIEAIQAKHVDDIKIGGLPHIVDTLITAIERVFGKLTVHRSKFTNCGVEHVLCDDGSIEMNQDAYIKALIPIQHPLMIGAAANSEAPAELIPLFWSLLGALAYSLMTQHWLAVYVVSLQRVTHKPLIIHIRRLNALVRTAQKRPAHIRFPSMKCARQLIVHSDSGFSKEQEKGYGIRGANFMRCGIDRTTGQPCYHLLESQCRSHKHVTRSTFSSETLACVAAADYLIPLCITMQEVAYGPLSTTEVRRLREEGNLAFRSTLVVDAMSLFAAVSAATVKVPAERSLAGHLFWLRELLDRQVVNTLRWCDTRDMNADCHTKGSVDRAAILKLMLGQYSHAHPVKNFP